MKHTTLRQKSTVARLHASSHQQRMPTGRWCWPVSRFEREFQAENHPVQDRQHVGDRRAQQRALKPGEPVMRVGASDAKKNEYHCCSVQPTHRRCTAASSSDRPRSAGKHSCAVQSNMRGDSGGPSAALFAKSVTGRAGSGHSRPCSSSTSSNPRARVVASRAAAARCMTSCQSPMQNSTSRSDDCALACALAHRTAANRT